MAESLVRVSVDPDVVLDVQDVDGPVDRSLLVIHGGPDWDCSYLQEPLVDLAGRVRVLLVDLRGCGRSARRLADEQYTWDAAAGADRGVGAHVRAAERLAAATRVRGYGAARPSSRCGGRRGRRAGPGTARWWHRPRR